MQTPTIDDIRREAAILEMDVDTSTDYIRITKRSDRSLFYYSLQPADDPRVLSTAWIWLQDYRANLERLDETRSQLAHQAQPGSMRYLLLFVVPVIISPLAAIVSAHNPLAGLGAFLLLLAPACIYVFCKVRAAKLRSQHRRC